MTSMEGDLSRAWKRLKKNIGWDDKESIAAELRETMIRFAPVPADLAEELADFFITEPVDSDVVYKSEEILELLSGTWAPENSVLEEDDWNFLKEQVNAWALEMDMDIVTDIMRAVVNRGGFSET